MEKVIYYQKLSQSIFTLIFCFDYINITWFLWSFLKLAKKNLCWLIINYFIDCFCYINIAWFLSSSLKLVKEIFLTPNLPLKNLNPWFWFRVSSKYHATIQEAFLLSLSRKSSNYFHVYFFCFLGHEKSWVNFFDQWFFSI